MLGLDDFILLSDHPVSVTKTPMMRAQPEAVAAVPAIASGRSLFTEHWWCDASTPGTWSSIEVALSSTRKLEFIFALKRSYGFTELTMPYLSRAMDITDSSSTGETQPLDFSDRLDVVREITARLPKHDSLFYTLTPESEFELPFNLSGYTTESQHTFRCTSTAPDHLMAIDAKTRQNIRRAAKAFSVRESADIGSYFGVFREYMSEKKQTNYVSDAPIERIWRATQQRRASTILNVHDDADTVVATAVLVWDDTHLYYWLSSRIPSKSKNNANSLLVWKAMELAQSKGLIFDMDGFNSPESGLFLAKFHLTPVRRVKLRWESTPYTWAATSRAMLKRLLPHPVRHKISKNLASR